MGKKQFLNWNSSGSGKKKSLKTADQPRSKLRIMERSAAAANSTASPGFAGMLAALTSSGGAVRNLTQAPISHDQADDVAILSYERALRTHARYRSAGSISNAVAALDFREPSQEKSSVLQAANSEALRIEEPANAAPIAMPQSAADQQLSAQTEYVYARNDNSPALDRNLKCASITIRMSTAECVQLRKRAAEAGLTVSAYLRSCTFETESLRALVKDTLARLRSASSNASRVEQSNAKQVASTPARLRWWERFWPSALYRRRVAQA
jgi:hypothetical protein